MITVTLGEVKPQEKPFPKLMKSKHGAIVYFVSPGVGLFLYAEYGSNDTCLNSEERKEISWPDMFYFADYNEPITIQNA